jgi:hypothetical protein
LIEEFSVISNKRNSNSALESDETKTTIIKCIFHVMMQSLVQDQVGSGFLHLWLQYDIDACPHVLIFDSPVLGKGVTLLWQ